MYVTILSGTSFLDSIIRGMFLEDCSIFAKYIRVRSFLDGSLVTYKWRAGDRQRQTNWAIGHDNPKSQKSYRTKCFEN